MEPLYTPAQAAEILQVHPKTVREWLRSKKLRGVLAGRFWRIRESALEAFLREPTDAAEPQGSQRRRRQRRGRE